jgi:SAM-dependent methyltransferase
MNKELWNKYGKRFSGLGLHGAEYCAPGAVEALSMNFEFKGRVLEIGSGNGGFYRKKFENNPDVEYYGIDIYTQDELDKYPWATGADMHDIPFADGSFDMAYSSNVFEHALSPIIALSETNRVLRNAAIFYLIVPEDNDTWINEGTHASCLSKRNWEALFRKTGFDVKKFEMHENGPMFVWTLMKVRSL